MTLTVLEDMLIPKYLTTLMAGNIHVLRFDVNSGPFFFVNVRQQR